MTLISHFFDQKKSKKVTFCDQRVISFLKKSKSYSKHYFFSFLMIFDDQKVTKSEK